MAETTHTRVAAPTTPEAFIADRQVFWSTFSRFVLAFVIGVAVLLILLTIFLV